MFAISARRGCAAAWRLVSQPGASAHRSARAALRRSRDDEGAPGEFGNPELKPYDAWNFDLSRRMVPGQQRRAAGGRVLQAHRGLHRRHTYACEDRSSSASNFGEALIRARTATRRRCEGVELGYQQSLSFLPAARRCAGGLQLHVHRCRRRNRRPDHRARRRRRENTFNASIGYEKGPISLRSDGGVSRQVSGRAGRRSRNRSLHRRSPSVRPERDVSLDAAVPVVCRGREPGRRAVRRRIGTWPAASGLLQYEEYSWTAKAGLPVYTF